MRARRVDANQAEIVATLRRAGASVCLLHTVGAGCPDVLCGVRGRNYLLECKTEHGTLNDREREWHWTWAGQVAVVCSAEEALRVVGVLASGENGG